MIAFLGLLTLFFLPGILRAQDRAALQVAATVLRVEPSRTALGAAVQAVDHGVRASQTALAKITVSPSVDAQKPRVVRIDFLRN